MRLSFSEACKKYISLPDNCQADRIIVSYSLFELLLY